MEKTVVVQQKVDDVTGLLVDLRAAGFNVKNVGCDPTHTYVYLEESEEKDPLPIVQTWIGRKPPDANDREAWEKRSKDLAAAPPVEASAPKPSFLKKIFKKILG